MGKDQYVVKHGDQWAVKGAGNVKITKIFNTQKEAMEYAKTITENQKSSMTVQSKTGKFRAKEASSSKKADDKKKAAAQKEAKAAAKAAPKASEASKTTAKKAEPPKTAKAPAKTAKK